MRRGAYLLPSFLTLTNMGLGFFAIIQSIHGNYPVAAIAIVFGHVADIIDGTVARITNTTSSFGLEFDSFADWITFGIAPAILMYQFMLKDMGKIGFGIAAFFVITGSLRLAKFNVKKSTQTEDTEDSHFVGLPIPGAGGIIAAIIILQDASTRPELTKWFPYVINIIPYIIKGVPVIMFFLSVLMVSRIQYYSTKKKNLFRPRSMQLIMLWVIGGLLMYIYPQNFTFLLYVIYVCVGLVPYTIRLFRFRRKKNEAV